MYRTMTEELLTATNSDVCYVISVTFTKTDHILSSTEELTVLSHYTYELFEAHQLLHVLYALTLKPLHFPT
jgi:hypothetical protein